MKLKFETHNYFEKGDWLITIIPSMAIAYIKEYKEFRILLVIVCWQFEIGLIFKR